MTTSSADPTPASSDANPLPTPAPLTTLRLTPRTGWQAVDWAELWRYRELTWFLALRDLQVRYKQTILGAAWAVIQPAVNTALFYLFFHKVAGVGMDPGVQYVPGVFCAMLIWQLFETSLSSASNSLVGNERLITKVYFPRLSIPISSVLTAAVDFAIGLALLIVVMAVYREPTSWAVLLMPVFALLAMTLAIGVGLLMSALNVQYRDVRYVLPFLIRGWLLASPVVYSIKGIPAQWQTLYGLNPMAGIVQGFKWAMLGNAMPPGPMLWASVAMTIVLLFVGLFYFRRMEKVFADVV